MTMTHEEKRTGPRPDDLDEKAGGGFEKVDKDLRELRGDLKAEATAIRGEIKSEVSGLRKETGERFDKVDARFDKARDEMKSEVGGVRGDLMSLHRLLLRVSIGVGVTFGVTLI